MTDERLTKARGADMNAEPEGFVSRWSRLKREAVQAVDAPPSATAAVTPAAASADSTRSAVAGAHAAAAATTAASAGGSAADPPAAVAEELPPIESLDGLNSDYVAFFSQSVGESVRRAALKKLFSDPHFNVMDGLDIYIDDYTHFEPIPEPLRQQLMSAAGFLNRAMPEAEAREQLTRKSPAIPTAPDDATPADQAADGPAAVEPAVEPVDRPERFEPAVVASVDGQDGAPPAAPADEKPAA